MSQASLSTMWAQAKFKHMTEFVVKAREFGFTHVEAHTSLSHKTLDELIETSFPISSIHSPCPFSLSSKDIPVSSLSLSSTEEAEQREAISYAKKTIDLASKTGARVVVIHMGDVPVNADLEEKLHRLYQEGLTGGEMYIQLKEQLISERSSKGPHHLAVARKSLDELSRYSRVQGIMLGLENRVNFREIPSINEMGALLNGVAEDPVGYWHDVSHAHVQQQLGFTPHEKWLLRFSDRMIGIHLHDVIGISDHCVPGKGNVDWAMITRYLPQGAIRTCEISQWNDEELIREAIPFLQSAGIIFRLR